MRILLASSEVFPYSKTGGLADMVGALGKYLARSDHETTLVTPLYRSVQAAYPDLTPSPFGFELTLGDQAYRADFHVLEAAPNLQIYFLNQAEFFDRSGLYQERGSDYPDNPERFIFFSKAVAYLARFLPRSPEIIHVHDWQTGLVPLLLAHQRKVEAWANAPLTCLTIHNLAYQGVFPATKYDLTNLPWEYFQPSGTEFYGGLNCLKAGIVYSDYLTTVSPRYAREITTPAFGCGLDGVLRDRQEHLIGILNGVDYDEWNTVKNPYLKHLYSADDLEGKTAGKLQVQSELGLPQAAHIPLFGSVTRLVEQKGIPIELGALEEMLASEMQFVLLGNGRSDFERAFLNLAKRYPKKVAVQVGYDHGLSHRIEAACDYFIMPSQFEPCGLNQMYSLRYGTIPIVRVTGGLDDSITDITEDYAEANGIKFFAYSARALAQAIRKALALYQYPDLLEHYRRNAMTADFSWSRTADDYVRVYERILAERAELSVSGPGSIRKIALLP